MSRVRARSPILPGTLHLLILRTLLFGPRHGHGIAKHIRQISEDVLQVEHGSLYPALQRLERQGWIASGWKADARGRDEVLPSDPRRPETTHRGGVAMATGGSCDGADAATGVRRTWPA